jgi:hypothetical protein
VCSPIGLITQKITDRFINSFGGPVFEEIFPKSKQQLPRFACNRSGKFSIGLR